MAASLESDVSSLFSGCHVMVAAFSERQDSLRTTDHRVLAFSVKQASLRHTVTSFSGGLLLQKAATMGLRQACFSRRLPLWASDRPASPGRLPLWASDRPASPGRLPLWASERSASSRRLSLWASGRTAFPRRPRLWASDRPASPRRPLLWAWWLHYGGWYTMAGGTILSLYIDSALLREGCHCGHQTGLPLREGCHYGYQAGLPLQEDRNDSRRRATRHRLPRSRPSSDGYTMAGGTLWRVVL